MKDLLDKLSFQIQRYKKLPSTLELIKSQNKKYKEELEEAKNKVELIQKSRLAYQKTIDRFYEESIGELEKLINTALKEIFFDRSLEIQIELSGEDKKDKSFSFEIIDTRTGYPEDIKDGTGAGVRSVISFIVLSYYLMQFDSPYIIGDESYSQISKDYVDGFFQFVKKLCDENNLTFILISHDERFISYADQIVSVSDGRVNILKELNSNDIEEIKELVKIYKEEEENEQQ